MSRDGQAYEWRLIAHVCRYCLGRVLERKDATGKRFYLCADCERRGDTGRVEAICCCGAGELDKAGRVIRRLGLHCVENPNPGVENPGVVVAQYQGVPERTLARTTRRREAGGGLPLFPGLDGTGDK